jgi:hypothetical protein
MGQPAPMNLFSMRNPQAGSPRLEAGNPRPEARNLIPLLHPLRQPAAIFLEQEGSRPEALAEDAV